MLPVYLPHKGDGLQRPAGVGGNRQPPPKALHNVPAERQYFRSRLFGISCFDEGQHPFDVPHRLDLRIVKICGPPQIRRPQITDDLPIQIERQGVMQRLHRLRIKQGDLFGRVSLHLFELCANLFEGSFVLLLKIGLREWAEHEPGSPADVVQSLFPGKKRLQVLPLHLFVRRINHSCQFSLGGLYKPLFPQPGERGPDRRGADLELFADVTGGGKRVAQHIIPEQDPGGIVIVDDFGHTAVPHGVFLLPVNSFRFAFFKKETKPHDSNGNLVLHPFIDTLFGIGRKVCCCGPRHSCNRFF